MYLSKKHLTIGILLLTIGISLLAGTIYRGSSTYEFGYLGSVGLEPKTWSFANQTNQESDVKPYLWPPCDLDLSIQTNSTIDVYILNSEGIRLWESQHVLQPIWSATGITGDAVSLQVPDRGLYYFLVYNSSNSTVVYKIDAILYGFERDLLFASIIFIVIGGSITALWRLLPVTSNKKK